ncbi:MAG: secretin N-terminal domain-containing protein [Negativicutes bacterium]|nr:secretin N-terminal domain-containing protein [Negativicutes bacterium]
MNLALAQPVSMTVQNAEVRDILTSLAVLGGVNMVVDESVKGKISVSFTDTPFDQAVEMIVRTRGLSYQKMADGTIIVAEAKTMLAGFGSPEVIPLKYALATDLKKALSGVVAEERLRVDEASNALVYFGSPFEVAQLRAAVTSLDIPCKQVSIEAQVVEINKTASKNIGFNWTFAPAPLQSGATGDDKFENKGAIRFGKAPDGQPYQFRYQAQLNALVEHGDAKVLAKPRVSTISGKEAKILIGDKIPVQSQTTTNGTTSTTVTYVDTGIRLVYTPVVSPDGVVRAHLLTEVSQPLPALGNTNYEIQTRTAETDFRMVDGETIAIGGLISKKSNSTRDKVPFLGDLPLVGGIFKNINSSDQDSEIMVFLTVKVLK